MRGRLLDGIAAAARSNAQSRPPQWRSRGTGYSCSNDIDGHELRADDLIEETEAKMGNAGVCKHCGDEIRWDPK